MRSTAYSVFVDVLNTVYVASQQTGLIQVWVQGNSKPTTINTSNASAQYALYVTVNNEIYVNGGPLNNGVDKWSLNPTAKTNTTYLGGPCTGLFIDLNNTLYCSIGIYHRVVTTSLVNSAGTIVPVAGNNVSGALPYMLSSPQGIFVHTNFTLFVADMGNNRIQQFEAGDTNGTTAAGNTSSPRVFLNRPTAVVLDGSDFLFIVDSGNNRIVGSDTRGFRCVAGCSNVSGSAANQLQYPRSLSFDSDGNIYVTDVNNSRVQKFNLTSVGQCGTLMNCLLTSAIQ